MHHRGLVPGLGRDFPGDVLGAAGGIEGRGPVLAKDAADDRQREAHQQPDGQQQEDGGDGQGLSGAIGPMHGVHHAPGQEEGS